MTNIGQNRLAYGPKSLTTKEPDFPELTPAASLLPTPQVGRPERNVNLCRSPKFQVGTRRPWGSPSTLL